MDKSVACVIGAVGALAASIPASAEAAVPGGLPAPASYADLLRPIPDALALLQRTADGEEPAPAATVEQVQYYPHHHHHHHYHRRYRHHHHHHHHHYD